MILNRKNTRTERFKKYNNINKIVKRVANYFKLYYSLYVGIPHLIYHKSLLELYCAAECCECIIIRKINQDL